MIPAARLRAGDGREQQRYEKTQTMPTYVTTPIYYVNAQPHLGHAYTTLVTDACVVSLCLEDSLEVVEDLSDHSDSLSLGLGTDRHDHELLEVDLVV